ncbi:hypothetical protein [Streptomyces sp. BE147]|uniref:hypothetical protein n=1 Tax=unclassified Streptomyces TaxID=2593676 RepID=UPI002E7619E9|nr:hypothetical protein [Streptomyces sp. BE147]MEE1737944.1 hypothetical protein [Streptomyces sp. BE147]
MTMREADLDTLDDRAVVLALEEISYALAARHPDGPRDQYEAWAVLEAVCAAAGELSPTRRELASPETARRVLSALAEDGRSADLVGPVLADPPADDQMALENLTDDLIVLGAVVGWLRLRVGVSFKRKDGRNTVSFEVEQKPASDRVLQSLARAVLEFVQQRQP